MIKSIGVGFHDSFNFRSADSSIANYSSCLSSSSPKTVLIGGWFQAESRASWAYIIAIVDVESPGIPLS